MPFRGVVAAQGNSTCHVQYSVCLWICHIWKLYPSNEGVPYFNCRFKEDPRFTGQKVGVLSTLLACLFRDNSAELIEAFAKVLRRRLKRGQCEDDVLIVYSVEDAQVFTVVGSVARRKLDPKVVAEVENLARK